MIKLNDYVIKADIFPDKTSQVWFIPKEELAKPWNIQWVFESESELMHLLQLKALLTSEDSRKQITLAMPFLPYGRQDKDVSNEQSFAFKVFKDTLMLHGFHRVFTIDAHNPEVLPMGWSNIMPREQIQKAIQEVKPHFICYPDTGASRRGYMHPFIPSFNMKKIRDQKTGDIKGIETELPL